MLTIIITAVSASVITVYLYHKLTRNTNITSQIKNDVMNGVIYLLDEDMDTKFTLNDLISPKFTAFEKPFETCNLIKQVPTNTKIKLVISTKGGSLTSVEKIIKTLKQHKAKYDVYIVGECYSAGAMLALGADEIIMGNYSYIGKIDPQKSTSTDLISYVNYVNLPDSMIGPENIQMVQEAKSIMNYMNEIMELLLKNHPSYKIIDIIKNNFIYSELPHCKLFDYNQCKELGLHVRKPTNDELKYLNILDK